MPNEKMVELLYALNEEKNKLGYKQDLLTPGFLKEVIIGGHLGHYVHRTKHGPDAYCSVKKNECYEYLSCKSGGSFQIDRIDESNLYRISRNDAFFFALFSPENSLKVEKIFRVETEDVLEEAKRKISKMKSTSKHVGFGIKWTQKHGKVVWPINNI
tara:strand:- start:637 stop:1107 length:471 start_codon:yes stop_codon:yes gene_type:complete